MGCMFFGVFAFNSDISGLDVSNVTNMSYMFCCAKIFNSDISGWDVQMLQIWEGCLAVCAFLIVI